VGTALALWILFATGSAQAASGSPKGWTIDLATEQIERGRVEFRYEPHLADGARYLSGEVPRLWSQIEQTLATDLDDDLRIHYVDHAGRVAEASGMPRWVAGVANSAGGEIMIARHGPSGSPTDLEALLRHEMTHVALHRATNGAKVPRWFNEGLAESLEGNVDLGRVETLANLVFGRGVPSLERMEAQFRETDDEEASAAYASARDLVNFLRYYDGQGVALRQLLTQLRLGNDFDTAVERAYGRSPAALVEEWRDGLPARYFWFPLVAGGGIPMGLVMPLMLAAWVRRRRERMAGWARLEAEEAHFRARLGLSDELR
jgi:hypothetical protein